jgi:hypothetical protein
VRISLPPPTLSLPLNLALTPTLSPALARAHVT